MNKLIPSLVVAALCSLANLSADSFLPEEAQGWRFSHTPEMPFQTEFTSEGLAITFQGITNSPNYMSCLVDVGWEVGAKGRVEVTVSARQKRGIYFAVQLVSSDGKSYKAIASGDPRRGYVIDEEPTVAELPFSFFTDEEGNRMPADTPIAKFGVIFAAEPEISNTITVGKIGIFSNAN